MGAWGEVMTQIRWFMGAAVLAVGLAAAAPEASAQRAGGGGLAEPKSPIVVALLPFKVNGPAEIGYLSTAIPEVLATRLATLTPAEQGAVTAALQRRNGAPLTEASARDIGRESGAQFVVVGSLTAVGTRLSLDARILPVTSGRPATIYVQGEGFENLLTQIGSLALEIDKGISGVQAFLGTEDPAPSNGSGAQPRSGSPAGEPSIFTRPGRTRPF
jgi:TolB-like protein